MVHEIVAFYTCRISSEIEGVNYINFCRSLVPVFDKAFDKNSTYSLLLGNNVAADQIHDFGVIQHHCVILKAMTEVIELHNIVGNLSTSPLPYRKLDSLSTSNCSHHAYGTHLWW